MTTHPVSPFRADEYASALLAFGDQGAATGMVLIGKPGEDGSFDAEYRPFDGSPHPGWKARYDRDRTCVEVHDRSAHGTQA